MFQYKPPTNDPDRLAFLQAALRTGQTDQANGRAYIQAATLTELSSFVPAFQAQMADTAEKENRLRAQQAVRREAVEALNQLLKSFWTVAKLQARRLDYPAPVLAFYGLYQDGRRPRLNSMADVLTYAQMAVSGDATAAAQGYQAVSNPSAAELDTALAAAQAADLALPDVQRAYNDAVTALSQARQQANWLIRLVYNELKVSLLDRTPAERRRIMRQYGVVFQQDNPAGDLPGEEESAAGDLPAEEETAAAAAAVGETAVMVPVNGHGLVHA